MLILFDHVTPRGIARFLRDHTVTRARERGWDTLTNGELLAEAERAGFDVFVTADRFPVVLGTPQWPRVRLHVERIVAAVNASTPGSYIEVEIPS
jgi:hypothetical protein